MFVQNSSKEATVLARIYDRFEVSIRSKIRGFLRREEEHNVLQECFPYISSSAAKSPTLFIFNIRLFSPQICIRTVTKVFSSYHMTRAACEKQNVKNKTSLQRPPCSTTKRNSALFTQLLIQINKCLESLTSFHNNINYLITHSS